MATTAKLVTDLSVTLRLMRSHEGVVATRLAQAASDDIARHLREVDAREHVVSDRVVRALRGLGAPAPRTRPSWLPSPASALVAVGARFQPLGETLVLEAATVRMIADRARVVQGVASSLGRTAVVDVATQIVDLYDDYAGWLVKTAAALEIDASHADLVPTTTQSLGGGVKDAVGAPARVYGRVADRTAAGVDDVVERVRGLVGLGSEKLEETVDDVVDDVVDAVADTAGSVQDALTPVQAGDLPVSRYDSRSAAEAAKAVRDLDDVDAVSTVLAYEAQHKDRKTVIDAGDKRVAQLSGVNS